MRQRDYYLHVRLTKRKKYSYELCVGSDNKSEHQNVIIELMYVNVVIVRPALQ